MTLVCHLPPEHPARGPWPVIVPVDARGMPTKHPYQLARALVALGAKIEGPVNA